MIIQLKRATAARWATVNPILEPGEPGVELDTGRQKIGDDDGTPWNDLPYTSGGGDTDGVTFQDLDNHIDSDLPHPIYDDGPSLALLYTNAKV